MKGLNLKKVAAVTAGLALVASSAFAVSFSDIADASNHSMKVNGIVVGANAAMSDNEAATNLAHALASKATYMTEAKTEMQMVDECTSAIGSLNKDNAKEKKWTANTNYNATVNKNTGSGKLDKLISETKNLKVDGDSLSVTFKENMFLESKVSYDDDEDVQEYVAELKRNNLKYGVTLTGDDLNLYNSDDGYDFDDGSNDYVQVPFLGKWYTLDKTDDSDDKLELLETSASNTWYTEGQTISGLLGKDGKTYTLKYVEGFYGSSESTVTLELYDEETNELVATEDVEVDATAGSDDVTFSFESGEDVGEEILQDSVYVESVTQKTLDNSDVVKAKIRTGLNRLVLQDDTCYPDYTETDSDECEWSSFVNYDDGVLTSYGVENTKSKEYKNDDALQSGDYVLFPNNYGAVEFVGFDEEDMGIVKIGVPVSSTEGSTNGVFFTDDDGVEHNVPFYFDLGSLTVSEDGDEEGTKIIFDGTTYFVALKNFDGNIKLAVVEGTDDIDGLSDSDYSITITAGVVDDTNVVTLTSEDLSVKYLFASYEDDGAYTSWLVLKGDGESLTNGTTPMGIDDILFYGTDLDESEDINSDDVAYYFVRDNDDFENIAPADWNEDGADLFNTDNFAIAEFKVKLNTTDYVIGYIDAESQELVNEEEEDLSNYTNTADYNGINNLYYDADNGIQKVITDDSTTIRVDDGYLYITAPDGEVDILFNFYDNTGLVTEGEPVCTKVEKQVTVPATEKSYGNLNVISDLEAIAGESYIVVGGYFVNDLFKKVAADKDATAEVFSTPLAVEGDKVKEMINGNLYVAGYTAEDTTEAVYELINDLTMN